MCHKSVLRWVPGALTSDQVRDRDVLEVGAYDVNGSVRPAVEALAPRSYLGVDQACGPRVDKVVEISELVSTFGPDAFDVVIATEVLEHVVDWAGSVALFCDVLRPGGVLLVTTRSPGFPYHPFPVDLWRYPVPVMGEILDAAGLVTTALLADPQFPGVFATAGKPLGWRAPWADRPLVDVFAAACVLPAP